MPEAFKYLDKLSPWVGIPIVLLTLFVVLWPKIYQVFRDLNADNRVFQNERRRFELLKLRYEIEAIRKSNGLEQISDDIPPAAESTLSAPSPRISAALVSPPRGGSASFWELSVAFPAF